MRGAWAGERHVPQYADQAVARIARLDPRPGQKRDGLTSRPVLCSSALVKLIVVGAGEGHSGQGQGIAPIGRR